MKIEIDVSKEEIEKIGLPYFLTDDQKRLILTALRFFVVNGSKSNAFSTLVEVVVLHELHNITTRFNMDNFIPDLPSYFTMTDDEIAAKGTQTFLEEAAREKFLKDLYKIEKEYEENDN